MLLFSGRILEVTDIWHFFKQKRARGDRTQCRVSTPLIYLEKEEIEQENPDRKRG